MFAWLKGVNIYRGVDIGALLFTVLASLALYGVYLISTTNLGFLNAPVNSFFFTCVDHAYEIAYPLSPLKSKLPLFIHDLDHCWIKENRKWLERRADPWRELCDRNSALYHEDKTGRSAPVDLFRKLKIVNGESISSDRTPWGNARNRLLEIKECAAALDGVRQLDVKIYLSNGRYNTRYDSRNPGPELPELFAEVLSLMPNLERVNWGVPKSSTRYFERAFVEANFRLPSVSELVPGAMSHYLIPMCPNLRRLEVTSCFRWDEWDHVRDGEQNPRELLIATASEAPSIQELRYDIGWGLWTPQVLARILQAMPNLTRLEILGKIEPRYWEDEWEEDDYDEEAMSLEDYVAGNGGMRLKDPYLKTVLRELLPYPNVTHLSLPYASELGLGFQGHGMCGNPYLGPRGRNNSREVYRQGAGVTEEAGKIVTSVWPHLKGLSIGGSRAEMLSDEDGDLSLKWPWTGRMWDWLLEMEPDR